MEYHYPKFTPEMKKTSYTRPKTKEKGHPWWAYVYDEYFDDVICPEYHALHYSRCV